MSTSLIALCQPDKLPPIWSLLVTLFGDLAQAPEAALSGAAINAVMDGMGVKPDATRVALHRLRKDDWIESTRAGRTSTYQLTTHGRGKSQAANPAIYGPGSDGDAAWLGLLARPRDRDTRDPDTWWLSSTAFVTTAADTPPGALRIPLSAAHEAPDWVQDALCPAPVCAAAHLFLQRLEHIERHAGLGPGLDPLTVAIVRTLLVHAWRRLILKVPAVPAAALPTAWVGEACRVRVHAILDRIGAPEAATLSAHVADQRNLVTAAR